MDAQALYVAGLAVASLALLVSARASLDLLGLGLVLALLAGGVLEAPVAFAGFANPTVLTLAGLFVIGEGLTRTGALGFVGHWMLRSSRGSETRLCLTLCVGVALTSAVASNTTVMLVFIPISFQLARELGCPLSRLLMPMAYASILGGTLTLVGSSTNLLASGAAQAFGQAPIGMFEMTGVGAVLCVVGIPAAVWLTRVLLPERRSMTAALAVRPMKEYVGELTVREGSALVGRGVDELGAGKGVRTLFLVRDDVPRWPPLAGLKIQAGDALMVRGQPQELVEMQDRLDLELAGETRFDPRSMVLFELAVAPRASVLGARVGDLGLWAAHGLVVVAVQRGGHHYRERASRMRLRTGDVLLVSGTEEARLRMGSSQDFFLLSAEGESVVLRRHGRRALMVLAAVVVLFGVSTATAIGRWLPLPSVALMGAVAMVLAGCTTVRRAYRSIDWPILLFVVGALALGEGLQRTGVAEALANGMVAVARPLGAAFVAVALLVVGTVLNQFTSPYAVTVLLMPIALDAAAAMGVPDSRGFVLAVVFAGSNAFATPVGHQVNLMVMGPGGYRASDFVRVGGVMCLLYAAVVGVAVGVGV